MRYLKRYELFEKKEEEKYTGKNRIILLGPPSMGKSTISKELSKELGLEAISLDMNQMKFGGFGEKNEIKCVEWALSNKVKLENIPLSRLSTFKVIKRLPFTSKNTGYTLVPKRTID